MDHLLTYMVFAPIAGAIIILFLPAGNKGSITKIAALITSLAPLFLSIRMLQGFHPGQSGMQFEFFRTWIAALGIGYHVGVDGLSVPLIVLTTLLSTISLIASWGIVERPRAYFALFLLLESSMLGVFVSLDFFLFYVFWEIMLVPMYFLIGIWGGPRKEYAAIKFFLYTLVGSLLMLIAILAVYFRVRGGAGPGTFDIPQIARALHTSPALLQGIAPLVWLGFFVGFAIKVPIFPFHTWLPDAHVEAPTAVSVILAGVLLKLGTYGLLRVNFSLFPETSKTFVPMLAILGVINILYGALVAMAQSDLKKLIAYSSVSHMGFCILGMASMTMMGINGAIMQQLNHGMVTAGLFLLVGVIYDRAHTREINAFGGLAKKYPVYAGFVWLVFFASLGLPGLNSFWGEFFVLTGAFNAVLPAQFANWTPQFFKIMIYITAAGIVVTAAYHLWVIQRMFLGPFNEKWAGLKDMDYREIITLVPTAIFAVTIGIMPALLLNLFMPWTAALMKGLGG